jgi:transketolase
LRNHFIEKLVSLSKVDSSTFLVVGDLGYGVIEPFAKQFPQRFLNAGVAEQCMVSWAAGMASTGKSVCVYSIANFPTFRALEQVRNDVAYHNLPVVIVAVGAGLSYGTLGYTHHAVEDLAVVRAIPNMSIYSPADKFEVDLVLPEILKRKTPSYLRLGKGGEPLCHDSLPNEATSGIALTKKSGSTLLLTTGAVTRKVMDAIELIPRTLSESISVFSIPMVSNLDLSALDIENRDSIVTVEEHALAGGFGSAVLENMADLAITKPVLRLGISEPTKHVVGSHEFLLRHHKLDADSIAQKLEKFLDSIAHR